MTEPIAEFVVSLKDGRIASQGTLSVALSKNKALVKEAAKDAEALHREEEDVNADDNDAVEGTETKKSDGKLIVAEEIQEGHLSWNSRMLWVSFICPDAHPSPVKLYLTALGGNHIMLFFVGYLGAYMVQELASTVQTWYLGYWASQYDIHAPADVNALQSVPIRCLYG